MAERVENVGIFTAYGFAREGGYSGTKQEFETGLARSADYANNAAASATAASNSAKDSEAYAIGKRNGTDVGSSDPAYHNNSKYYDGLAAGSAQNADTSAKDAEAYAVGKRGGVDVGSSDPAYHNNAKYYAAQAQQGGILVNDTTNNITYIITLKLINGKPVVEYETTV